MRANLYQKICLGFYILLIVFWIWLFSTGSKDGFYNYLYSFVFGLIPLIGGLVAMINSRGWGSSAIGKAVLFTGLGLFLWGCGETIWSYYNFFLNVPAPYPSLADVGFAPSIFFYGIGAVFLTKATGAKYGLRDPYAKIVVAVGFIALAAFAYHVLVNIARGGVLVPEGEPLLKAILDIAYPLGNFLSLAIAVIASGLSFKYLGGKFLPSILAVWAGLAVMFIGDFTFSYTTTTGSYYNGNFGDLILTTGLFLLTFGILGFQYKPED